MCLLCLCVQNAIYRQSGNVGIIKQTITKCGCCQYADQSEWIVGAGRCSKTGEKESVHNGKFLHSYFERMDVVKHLGPGFLSCFLPVWLSGDGSSSCSLDISCISASWFKLICLAIKYFERKNTFWCNLVIRLQKRSINIGWGVFRDEGNCSCLSSVNS